MSLIANGLMLCVAATFLMGCSGPGNSNIGMVMGGTAGVTANAGGGNGGGLNTGGGIAGNQGGQASGGEAGDASGGTAGTNGGEFGTGGTSEDVPDASTSPQGGDSGQEPNTPTCPVATDAENGMLIEVDGTYGFYAVAEIIILDGAAGAPCGRYTFHVASPTAGEVTLQRDGVPVATTTYFWRETISATDPTMFHSFQFGGYFFITIRKAGMGTINLGGMDQSIFDGMRVLLIP